MRLESLHFILYLIIGYSAVTIIADLEGLLIEKIYVEILELIRLYQEGRLRCWSFMATLATPDAASILRMRM